MFVVPLLLLHTVRADTLDIRGVFRVAAQSAFMDATKNSVAPRNAQVVYVDVTSFRIAAGLDSTTTPDDWKDVTGIVGSRGRIGRAAQVLHCSGAAERNHCVSPPASVTLVKFTGIHRTSASLEVDVEIRTGQHALIYAEHFSGTGGKFDFQSGNLLMVMSARD